MADVTCLLLHQPLLASDADLAQELSNPIADLITVPVQMNYDRDIGADDGSKLQTNIQPVIPFDLAEDLNLITRTILPVISQKDSHTTISPCLATAATAQKNESSPAQSTEKWVRNESCGN